LAKKKIQDPELQKGLEQLRQEGIDADAAPPALVELLTQKTGAGKATDQAIAFLLGRIADRAAVAALSSMEQRAGDKAVKREIRRALYKLGQKGLAVPEPKIAEDKKPVFRLGPEIEGYMSSTDGAGNRLVWLVKPHPAGGIQVLQGMFNDREGLVHANAGVTRRKELRKMAEEMKESQGFTMIAVPWGYADQILYEAFEKAKAAGRSGVEQFPSLRQVFNTAKPAVSDHPIYARLNLEDIRSGVWRNLSGKLFEEREFETWILEKDWLEPYLEKIEEARGSRLVLNKVQQKERVAGIVRDAVQEIFSSEKGKVFQRRMEDMALYLFETKREQEAKLALSVALAIAEGDLGGLGVSFLNGLAQRSIAFYVSEAKEEASEEPSLIVKP
jgi:hypothetical protein